MTAYMSAEELLLLALVRATKSPDPSTQNGAILARNRGLGHYEPILETLSCNDFPFDVSYSDERWERPLKYSFVEHAERNAIYKAAMKGIATEGLTLACPWAACADCARSIIQSGCDTLITMDPTANTAAHWTESIAIAMGMLEEASVKVKFVKSPLAGSPTVRRDGELITL